MTCTQGADQARVHTLPEASAILDIFQKHGHNEIDTARFYGAGSSEEFLGDLNWKKRGIVMDTKYYPTRGKNMPVSRSLPPQLSHCAAAVLPLIRF